MSFDKAAEYVEKMEQFVNTLNTTNVRVNGDTWVSEKGRKFDRVFMQNPGGQKSGRYFVDRNSWKIYGIKSWAQVNPRRQFGTLDTVSQFDWSGYTGTPKAGTPAEKEHTARESQIVAGYAKRGRPRKK